MEFTIYRALKNLYDVDNPSVKVQQGMLITFDNAERAQNALKNGLIEEVNIFHLEDKENSIEDKLEALTVAELKEMLIKEDIDYPKKAKKADFIKLLKSR